MRRCGARGSVTTTWPASSASPCWTDCWRPGPSPSATARSASPNGATASCAASASSRRRLRAGRRPVCKACLDWSERRSHLAGALGKALLDRIYALGWARRLEGGRVLTFTAPGLAAFERTFSLTRRRLVGLGGRIASRIVPGRRRVGRFGELLVDVARSRRRVSRWALGGRRLGRGVWCGAPAVRRPRPAVGLHPALERAAPVRLARPPRPGCSSAPCRAAASAG